MLRDYRSFSKSPRLVSPPVSISQSVAVGTKESEILQQVVRPIAVAMIELERNRNFAPLGQTALGTAAWENALAN